MLYTFWTWVKIQNLPVKSQCRYAGPKIDLDQAPNTPKTCTVLHIFAQVLFCAENQGNHQNFDLFILSYKFGLIFMGKKQKK